MRDPQPDGPAAVLALAIRLLSPDRHHRGEAMSAELGYVSGSAHRWRFAIYCAQVAVVYWRPTVTRRRLLVLTLVLGALAACWWTYRILAAKPGDDRGALLAILVLAASFGAYTWLGTSALAGEASHAIVIWGVGAGFAVALTWVAAVTLWVAANANPAQPPLQWPAVVAGLALPGVVGGWTARLARRERAGTEIGMWTGLVAGPIFAIGVTWVMVARNGFLAGGQDLSWSLGPSGAADAILGLLFIPVACTLIAGIGAGLSVSWPWALAPDTWRGVSAGPLVLMVALCSIAIPVLSAQVEDFGYYQPIRAADRAAASLDAANDVNAVGAADPVDIARSSDTFVVVFDRAGRPLAGSVLVDGRAAVFPAAVLVQTGDPSSGPSASFGPIPGQSMRLGEWPSSQDGGAFGVVAIQSWSGGYVVAGNSLPPRVDIAIFGVVLLGLLVALMLVHNGRPGMGEIRLARPEPI